MLRIMGKKEKAYIGKEASLEIKKSNHYYKGIYQDLLYFPHPVCWKSTRASSTVCPCQKSDQSILMQKQTKKKIHNSFPKP